MTLLHSLETGDGRTFNPLVLLRREVRSRVCSASLLRGSAAVCEVGARAARLAQRAIFALLASVQCHCPLAGKSLASVGKGLAALGQHRYQPPLYGDGEILALINDTIGLRLGCGN